MTETEAPIGMPIAVPVSGSSIVGAMPLDDPVESSNTTPRAATGVAQGLVRPFVVTALTSTVCYLAITGLPEARTALIGAFAILVGALWGERAALKIPGQSS